MRPFWKFLSVGALVLTVLLAGAVSLTIGWRPFLGPRARALTERKFEATPERLARGRYLANAVTGCMFCHSTHDWQAPGAPIVEGRVGVTISWLELFAKVSAMTAELCFHLCRTIIFARCRMRIWHR